MGDHMDYLMLVDKFNPIPDDFEKTISLEEVQGSYLKARLAGNANFC